MTELMRIPRKIAKLLGRLTLRMRASLAAPIEQESRDGLFDRVESAARLSAAPG
jgi:hypothetical protein